MRLPFPGLLPLAVAVLVHTARSVVHHVPADQATIAAALNQAAAGDTVMVAPGVYHENHLEMNQSLTLMGENPTLPEVVIDGDGSQILTVADAGPNARLQSLAFQHGGDNDYYGEALVVMRTPALSISHCLFQHGSDTQSPSLRIYDGSSILVVSCQFLGGEASWGGGALSSEGEAILLECDFSGFMPVNQQAIVLQAGQRPMRLLSCTFHDNGVEEQGTGVRRYANAGLLALEGCDFNHNRLGCLALSDEENNNLMTLSDCVLRDNSCANLVSMNGRLENCRMSGNASAAALVSGTYLTLEDCSLSDNHISSTYLADLINAQSLTLIGCTLAANECPGNLLQMESGALDRCLLVANESSALTGLLASLSAVRCTDSYGNSCGDWGGVLAPFSGVNGNWSSHPLLRDLELGDLRPALGSPARPEGNACGELVGALPPVDEAPRPMARFSLTPPAGALPLVVDVHALDRQAADSWSWDFNEDGAPDAFGADAQWTFTAHGRHDVTLVVGGDGENRSLTRHDAITVGGVVVRVPEDEPTLADAFAQTLPADTVDLACGEYAITSWLTIPGGIELRARGTAQGCVGLSFLGSEWSMPGLRFLSGPLATRLRGLNLSARATGYGQASLSSWGGALTLTDCTLRGDLELAAAEGDLLLERCRLDSLGTVAACFPANLTLDSCHLTHCDAVGYGRIGAMSLRNCRLEACGALVPFEPYYTCGSLDVSASTLLECDGGALIGENFQRVSMERVLMARGSGDVVAEDVAIDTLEVSNCDIWGNADGNWTGVLAPFAGVAGNRETDPYFCAPETGDYFLAANSSCVLGEEDFIGAGGIGCERSLPMAEYTTSAVSGPAPLTVSFNQQGMGEISSLQWDLDGDGVVDATGQTQIVWHYPTPGVYQPLLHVTGPGGSDDFAGPPICVGGRTLRVPGDAPTIGEALAQSAAGDTVIIGCGTWFEHDLTLPAGVLLKGEMSRPCAVIDGAEQGPILQIVDGGRDTRIEDLEFSNGSGEAGGALRIADPDYFTLETVRLRRCGFFRNSAIHAGGAVANLGGRTVLHADSCSFTDNNAGTSGGAIYCGDGEIANSLLQRNHAQTGGAINSSSILARNCDLLDNTAQSGGAVAGLSHGRLVTCRLGRNHAEGEGGAVQAGSNSANYHAVIDSCLFFNNCSGDNGSSLWDRGPTEVLHCTFFGDSTASNNGVLAFEPYYENDPAQIQACIVAGSRYGRSVSCTTVTPLFSCTDMWGNQGLNWPPPVSNQQGQDGNISVDPRFCNTDSLDFTLEEDSPCRPEHNACGLLGGVSGDCHQSGLPSYPVAPLAFALHSATPNPFNPSTLLRFELEREGPARLALYNLLGQEVRVLVDERLPAGLHRRQLDASGLASGVYVVSLRAEGQERQLKILLLK